jgi:sec-independent protein translocase protein TatA
MGLDNPLHIAFLVVILLLVFGARRLPEIGRSLGGGMREFKDSISGEAKQLSPMAQQQPVQPQVPAQPVAQRQPPQPQAPPIAQQQPAGQPPVAQPVAAPAPVAVPQQPAAPDESTFGR